jgi:hypothetical protein
MGTLTRAQMEQAIQAGGSVLWRGQILTHVAQLPSEADLAAGDPALEAAASAALDAQILALTREKAQLDLARQPQIPPALATATDPELTALVGQEFADRLAAAGYDTPAAVAQASDAELLDIDGIGKATVKRLRDAGASK